MRPFTPWTKQIDRWVKLRLINLAELLFSRKPLSPDVLDRFDPKRVLIVRPQDQLGDFLLSTPAIDAVRGRFPKARMGILVKDYFADTVRLHPALDEVLVFYPKIRRWTAKRMSAFFLSLAWRWDMTIVLSSESHSFTSDLLAALSGAKIILGSDRFVFPGCRRNFLYNLTAPDRGPDRHQTERNLDIVEIIGAKTGDLREKSTIDPAARETLRANLQRRLPRPGELVIGLHVGANKSENRWPAEKFAELAGLINRRLRANVLLLWGSKESGLAERFMRNVSFEPVQMPPSSLMDLALAFSLCDAAVCNDTGIMHLCAAVGTPLAALFGPIDPEHWKPAGESTVAIRGRENRTESIRVEDVMKELEKLLKKHSESNRKKKPNEQPRRKRRGIAMNSD
jgi:ADP-heptose:LPS heptosyltransferase